MSYNNNQNTPYGSPYIGAPYGYAENQVQQPKMTQLLTPEEMAKLNKQKKSELQIDDTEFLEALCCHRRDGKSVLKQTNDGRVHCPICHQTFNLLDSYDVADIQNAVDVIDDVMQSTKTMYVDLGEQTGKQFFQIMPLIKRIPKLYKMACDDIQRYNGMGMQASTANTSGYQTLNGLLGGGYGMQPSPYGYQPPYGQPYNVGGAPQYPPYGQPGPGYYPNMQQPQYAPQGGYAPQGYPQQAPQQYAQPGYNPNPQAPSYGDPNATNPFVNTGMQQNAPQQEPAPMTPPQGAVVQKNEAFKA